MHILISQRFLLVKKHMALFFSICHLISRFKILMSLLLGQQIFTTIPVNAISSPALYYDGDDDDGCHFIVFFLQNSEFLPFEINTCLASFKK